MPRGVVREYDSERGLGVIEEERGTELRVHRSGLGEDGLQALYAGDVVEYRVGRSRQGAPTAIEVVRIGWEEPTEDDGSGREWSF